MNGPPLSPLIPPHTPYLPVPPLPSLSIPPLPPATPCTFWHLKGMANDKKGFEVRLLPTAGGCRGGAAPPATTMFGRAVGTRPNIVSPTHPKICILRHVSSSYCGTLRPNQLYCCGVHFIANIFQSGLFFISPPGDNIFVVENWFNKGHWEHTQTWGNRFLYPSLWG